MRVPGAGEALRLGFDHCGQVTASPSVLAEGRVACWHAWHPINDVLIGEALGRL